MTLEQLQKIKMALKGNWALHGLVEKRIVTQRYPKVTILELDEMLDLAEALLMLEEMPDPYVGRELGAPQGDWECVTPFSEEDTIIKRGKRPEAAIRAAHAAWLNEEGKGAW